VSLKKLNESRESRTESEALCPAAMVDIVGGGEIFKYLLLGAYGRGVSE
jgi:hypothetical protein